jgi:glutathione-regulated potassium-efflux system ancillary protein KefC
MHIPPFLLQALVYLGAAVIAVPLFKRLGLGSVLGYLVAGLVIGPFGLKLIPDVESVLQISELGVVLLLFLVGLELNPSRLWEMRRTIFGLGGLQVLVTVTVVSLLSRLTNLPWSVCLVIGMAVSMSSTAISIQILNERSLLKTAAGQSAFSVALFQDLAVVPLMLILTLLSPDNANEPLFNWTKMGKAVALILALILVGRFLLKPLLRIIAKTGMREIFIACALFLIVGSALLTASVGLSMALGSFLAGVLLADSEYRMELEVDIEPFKGLLLGLFFIAVGMSINVGLILKQPLLVIGLAVAAVAIKFAILRGLGLLFKLCRADGWVFAIVISQIGEFAFVLTSVAQSEKVISLDQSGLINAVVAFSMLTTPLMMVLYAKYLAPKLSTSNRAPEPLSFQENQPVIIAGVGRFGQIVGRVLQAKSVPITLIDVDPNQLELLERFGWKTHYGDARRPDVLEAAGIEHAQLIVLAMDDVSAVKETAEYIKEHYPKIKVIARARSRVQAFELIAIGVTVVRETFESSLKAAHEALMAMGISNLDAQANVQSFREHDERLLIEMASKRDDQTKLIAAAERSRQELRRLLSDETNAVQTNAVQANKST